MGHLSAKYTPTGRAPRAFRPKVLVFVCQYSFLLGALGLWPYTPAPWLRSRLKSPPAKARPAPAA